MRPKVVVTNWVHPEVVAFLAAAADVEANSTREPWPAEEVRRRARDADAILAFMTDRIDVDFLAHCPKLKVAACALKGYDNFDLAACTERGVCVTIVPDLLTAPTAELAVGLAIALGRKIREGDRHVRSGAFSGWRPHFYGTGLANSTAGILGFGAVGRAIARRLSGFGCRILWTDRQQPGNEAIADACRVALDELLAESDFLFAAVPLTPDTLHLIDQAALARMKPGALLVNAGRGSVVDEAAVAAALAEGRLGGYAADVFEMEDWARPERPRMIAQALLADEARTVLTPHLGSAVNRVRHDIAMTAAHDIVVVLRGGAPANAINFPKKAARVGT
jgi:phosphonate dehydrogenase